MESELPLVSQLTTGSTISAYRQDSVIVEFENQKNKVNYITGIQGTDLFNEIANVLLQGRDETRYELILTNGMAFDLTMSIPFEGLPPEMELVLQESMIARWFKGLEVTTTRIDHFLPINLPCTPVSDRPIKVFGWYENEHSYEKYIEVDAGELMGAVKNRYLRVPLNSFFHN